eukprot:c34338_g1_i1 orf=3-416(-)
MFLQNSSSLSTFFPASNHSVLSETSDLNAIAALNGSHSSVPIPFSVQGNETFFPPTGNDHRLSVSTAYGTDLSVSENPSVLDSLAKRRHWILGPYSPSSTLISVDAMMSTSISDSCSIDVPKKGTVHPVPSCLRTRKR